MIALAVVSERPRAKIRTTKTIPSNPAMAITTSVPADIFAAGTADSAGIFVVTNPITSGGADEEPLSITINARCVVAISAGTSGSGAEVFTTTGATACGFDFNGVTSTRAGAGAGGKVNRGRVVTGTALDLE